MGAKEATPLNAIQERLVKAFCRTEGEGGSDTVNALQRQSQGGGEIIKTGTKKSL